MLDSVLLRVLRMQDLLGLRLTPRFFEKVNTMSFGPPIVTTPKALAFGEWLFVIGPHAKAPKTLAETLTIARESGFNGIALGGFGGEDHVTPERYPDLSSRDDLRLQLADFKLDVMAPNVWTDDFNWLERGGVLRYANSLRPWAQLAKDIEVPGLRIDLKYGPEIGAEDPKATMKRAVNLCQECGAVGKEFDLPIHLELEPAHTLVNTAEGAEELGERTRGDYFGLMGDWCHLNAIAIASGTTVLALISKLSPYLTAQHAADNLDGKLVHCTDFDHPATGEHLPLGDGNVDLRAVARAMQNIPTIAASGIVTLDMCFYVGEYPDVLIQSRKVLEQLYGQVS